MKRKWWGVEYETGGLGFEKADRMTWPQATELARSLGKECSAWVVEVVERRKRVQAFEPPSSPNARSSASPAGKGASDAR